MKEESYFYKMKRVEYVKYKSDYKVCIYRLQSLHPPINFANFNRIVLSHLYSHSYELYIFWKHILGVSYIGLYRVTHRYHCPNASKQYS